VLICAEQEPLFESKSLQGTIIDLIATYFVFDVASPKPLATILIFFQHYVFNLKDKQSVPNNTLICVDKEP